MSRPAPPLRFLGLVIGGWIGLRLVVLLGPDPWASQPRPAIFPSTLGAGSPARATARGTGPIPGASEAPPAPARRGSIRPVGPSARSRPPVTATAATFDGSSIPFPDPSSPEVRRAATPLAPPALPPARGSNRWSASAWLLVRAGEGGALATGGTLGGSQAGARLLYRLNGNSARPLALAARLDSPLRQASGAEAAIGLDWRPATASLHLLAERRQAIGRDGRSAFSLAFYGGGGLALADRFRLEAYVQAGLVGLRRRDGFADGAARLAAPLGPFEIGGGLWGAIQPGVGRLDAGPSVALRLPVRGRGARLQADWRFRLAGRAAPASGPALTLASDF